MGLAAAACTLLGMGASEAVVTLTFQQVGPNVTATWSGTYDLPGMLGTGPWTGTAGTATVGTVYSPPPSLPFQPQDPDVNIVVGTGSDSPHLVNLTGTSTVPPAFIFATGTYTGATFGFQGGSLIIPGSATPGLHSPSGVMTFTNTTLAALGAANFNNTLAFTGSGDVSGSRQIVFTTAVPEPSSALLGFLGLLPLLRRRR